MKNHKGHVENVCTPIWNVSELSVLNL